jgi:hypothetical protein
MITACPTRSTHFRGEEEKQDEGMSCIEFLLELAVALSDTDRAWDEVTVEQVPDLDNVPLLKHNTIRSSGHDNVSDDSRSGRSSCSVR